MNPNPYYYTGVIDQVVFTLVPFTSQPSKCSIFYSCALVDGPITNVDLCNTYNPGVTAGTFDALTGSYTFQTIDIVSHPPGIYTFEVTGKVGNKSASITFTVEMIDPCPDAVISLT